MHESGNGNNKNVDIQTPMGSMSVKSNEAADTKAIGLAEYPGAKQVSDDDDHDNSKAANVNMSFGGFGLKVAAAHYHTSDSTQKVQDFYKKELSKYGNVLVCSPEDRESAKADDNSDVLTCNDKGRGMHVNGGEKDDLELKAGTKHRQHIVAIKPKNGGTDFGLVFVEIRGGKENSM
ncbi:MAG TPA: hypothetical protein VGC88_07420 [Terriglobales bacterium]